MLVALKNSGLGNWTTVVEFLKNFHYGTLQARHKLGSKDTARRSWGGYQNRPKGC